MDRVSTFLAFIIIVIFLCIGVISGAKLERGRIYDKCLEDNNYMIYSEAVAFCKTRIR